MFWRINLMQTMPLEEITYTWNILGRNKIKIFFCLTFTLFCNNAIRDGRWLHRNSSAYDHKNIWILKRFCKIVTKTLSCWKTDDLAKKHMSKIKNIYDKQIWMNEPGFTLYWYCWAMNAMVTQHSFTTTDLVSQRQFFTPVSKYRSRRMFVTCSA